MAQIDRRTGLQSDVSIKAPVDMASTANLTLSGIQTIDGVTGAADKRVLAKDQDIASENGIWIMKANAWERAPDFNTARDVTLGCMVPIGPGGTANAKRVFMLTAGTDIGSDSLTFAVQFDTDLADLETEITALGGITTEMEAIYTNLTVVQNASANALLAEAYATEDEDVEVETGTYSAKHWAAKAAEIASGSAANISFTPAGDLSSTDVQAALEELDTEKSATGHTHDDRYYTESEVDALIPNLSAVSQDIVSDADGTRDLGSSSNRFAEVHADAVDLDGTDLQTALDGKQADLDVPSQAEAEAGTSTTERVWTAQRVKQAIDALGSVPTTLGAVGTYAFLYRDAAVDPGDTISGAGLSYTGVGIGSSGDLELQDIGSSPSGTWRCMGDFNSGAGTPSNGTVYVRIS